MLGLSVNGDRSGWCGAEEKGGLSVPATAAP